MIIYEQERSNQNHYIYHQNDINLAFPIHMHSSFEFITVLEGSLEITIEDKTYTLHENDSTVILPNESHSYETNEYSKSYLCIFSADYVNDFSKKIESTTAVNPIFKVADAKKTSQELQNAVNIFALKSSLYHILSIFYASTKFVKYTNNKSSFIHDVLTYIEGHYAEDITLHDIARDLGYTYNYTSSLFNQIFKTNFSAFLNGCRISSATKMLIDSQKTISEIASLCGYNSLRAFNRNFLKLKKTTPTDYRKNYSEMLKIQ